MPEPVPHTAARSSEPVDLYAGHYSHLEAAVYREVRAEIGGEDLGQTSWISAAECDEFCRWLAVDRDTRVLEVACGSGGVSVRMAQRLGALVTGVDVNAPAIAAATARGQAHGVAGRARFSVADADRDLPFPDGSFDVVFCNDAINHFRDRRHVLGDWHRVLRPGGRCLYTDPCVITGCVSNAELAARSSIGFYLFTAPGANEEGLRATGFRLLLTSDVTESMAGVSARWHAARRARRPALVEIEGEAGFEDLQRFLDMVHALARERRLSRLAFMAGKPLDAGGPEPSVS